MEAMAWWGEEGILQRLRDHFAGVPNAQAEYFNRIKRYEREGGREIKEGTKNQ
jgi:hypothetical protein